MRRMRKEESGRDERVRKVGKGISREENEKGRE